MKKLFITIALSLFSCVAFAGIWGAPVTSASLVAPYPTSVPTSSGMNLMTLGSSHGHPYWYQLTVSGGCVTGAVHYYYVNTITRQMGGSWQGMMTFRKQICS